MPSTAGTREVAPAGACFKSASKLDALHTLRALSGQRTSRQRMECVQLAGAFRTARTPGAASLCCVCKINLRESDRLLFIHFQRAVEETRFLFASNGAL